MTYSDILDFRDSDTTGIVKGYDLEFLQNFYKKEKLEETVKNDLKLFKTIEQNLLSIDEPKEGEFVEYEVGKFARISRLHKGDSSFQISNKVGVYVWENGAQASGCTWDSDLDHISSERLVISNLQPTTETRKGKCWTFSGNQSGGGRGVWFEINFKVWRLI